MVHDMQSIVSEGVLIWHGFGGKTKAAVIGAIATSVAAIAGFGGLIAQMKSQGKQSREAIAENERRKIKAAMYEDAVVVCDQLNDAAVKLSTKLHSMAMQVDIASQASVAGLVYDIPSVRFPLLAKLYDEFTNASLRFIFLVENRRFVDTRILIFRTALNSVLHNTSDLMYSQFVVHVMPALPTDSPNGGIFPYTPPPLKGVDKMRSLSDQFIANLNDATSYSEDFLVELQNHLLGDLFRSKVQHREPIDPRLKVITLDSANELEQWFRASTPWGLTYARVEAECKERLSGQALI